MSIGHTVTRLSITPVKGLLLHHPDSIELTAHGAVGDRLFYLVDSTGEVQSCTDNPGLYGLRADYDSDSRRLQITRNDDVLLSRTVEPAETVETDMWGLRTIKATTVADPVWSTFFTDLVGKPVQLLQASASAYDVHPATMLGTASVQQLAHHAGLAHVDARRFRMLIEFSANEPHVEDSWDDRLVKVGSVLLRSGGPVKRCAAVTRAPDSGAVNLQTIRLITGYRGRQTSALGIGAHFGVYADVVKPGTISVGDALTLSTDE
jgi:uncharacterized protein YcbX